MRTPATSVLGAGGSEMSGAASNIAPVSTGADLSADESGMSGAPTVLPRYTRREAEDIIQRHEAQILEELNVKAVEMLAPDAELVSYRIKPNLPRIGKRYGKRVPAIRDALAAADGSAIAAAVAAGRAFDVEVGDEAIAFEPEDVLVESTSAEGYSSAEEGGYLIGLDTTLTEALEREGLARELVRTVQEARKQAGLEVSDRITLRIDGSPEVAAALDAHRDYVMEETLATGWGDAGWSPAYSVEHSLGATQWAIGLTRAEKVG